MNYKKIYQKVLAHYQKLLALQRASATIEWDINTYMPSDAGIYKGRVLSELSVLAHNFLLDKEFVKNIEILYSALQEDKLNQNEFDVFKKGNIRLLHRAIKHNKNLPEKFVKEFSQLTADAFNVWRKAKQQNDFKSFAPYLEKIFQMTKQKAEFWGYKNHPYDALIDAFEEGITTQDVEDYFNKLIPALKDIFEQIKNKSGYKPNSNIEQLQYNKEQMIKLNHKVLDYLLFDKTKSRLDVAPHPFTTTLGKNDVRITTWYHDKDFRRSLSATIHEWGHALHALGLNEQAWDTPSEEHSYAIAESQSRFMENIVGRNINFLSLWIADFAKLGDGFKNFNEQDYYHYFNMVRPSLIRVEADEVTYHFHIYIRFMAEKSLIEGSLKVTDLPDYWNTKFEELLDISVPDYKNGVLQDVHWSEGYIGYFPTYSMGTILSMQMAQVIEEKLGKINNLAKNQAGIKQIREFLRKTIHTYGASLQPKQLIEQSFGKYLDVNKALEYLRKKYL